MNKSIIGNILDIVLFVIAFVVIQFVILNICAFIWAASNGLDHTAVIQGIPKGEYGALTAVANVFSSLITVVVFAKLKWTPVKRQYLASKPWFTLVWVILLTIGLILPLQWIYEQMEITLSKDYEALFSSLFKEPWGYVAVGVLAPVAEEFVFRGAILRTLLGMMDRKLHWVAIAISALLFAVIHGNLAQGVNAFALGCLIGWMYYRTNSLIPGIVLHWTNNTVAYVLANLFPQLSDGNLIDFFHGDEKLMWGGLFFSLCIVIPSFFQLFIRLKKAE